MALERHPAPGPKIGQKVAGVVGGSRAKGRRGRGARAVPNSPRRRPDGAVPVVAGLAAPDGDERGRMPRPVRRQQASPPARPRPSVDAADRRRSAPCRPVIARTRTAARRGRRPRVPRRRSHARGPVARNPALVRKLPASVADGPRGSGPTAIGGMPGGCRGRRRYSVSGPARSRAAADPVHALRPRCPERLRHVGTCSEFLADQSA